MKRQAIRWSILSMVLALAAPSVLADVTSPRIMDRGKKYTTEKPDASYYGRGGSGRLVEASELRICVDELIAAGEWEQALPKARKAVQLDPGDPQGHIYYARCLTNKFYQTKGEPDEKTLVECLHEWEMIRRHDADPTEQWEAGNHVKQLKKIARAIEKEKLQRERDKEMEEAEEEETEAAESKIAKRAVPPKTAVAAKAPGGAKTAPAPRATVAPKTSLSVRPSTAKAEVSAKIKPSLDEPSKLDAAAAAEATPDASAEEAPAPSKTSKPAKKVAGKRFRIGWF